MEFLGSHTAPRSNMIYIRKHTYFVGQTKKITLSTEQAAIVIGDTAQSFTRLHKDGVLYHSTSYTKGCGKRDSTICSFIDKDKSVQFGQIQIFIKASKPIAFIHKFPRAKESLVMKAGHPCRCCLLPYVHADVLDKYIVPLDACY